jgi:hypothetical protein
VSLASEDGKRRHFGIIACLILRLKTRFMPKNGLRKRQLNLKTAVDVRAPQFRGARSTC